MSASITGRSTNIRSPTRWSISSRRRGFTDLARLRLYREPAAWADRLRAYTLLVDGVPCGAVKQGETLEVDLPPGDHRVQMKIDWATSPVLSVSGDRDVDLRCRANASPLLNLLYITIWRDRYIR